MRKHNNKGQSILEYSILLGVIIAALLIMQVFVKRGFQGGLKDSADKMGEQFSASSTTMLQNRTLSEDQKIKEETGTTAGGVLGNFTPPTITVKGTIDKGAYSYTDRSYGNQTSSTRIATDSAVQEGVRWRDYANVTVQDFNITGF